MSLQAHRGEIVYECGTCGVWGVKLWRDYQTFLNHQTLRCRRCAEEDQREHIENSRRTYARLGMKRPESDQIGYLIPAVPTYERDTFWG